MTNNKNCSKCHKDKLLSAFYVRSDGRPRRQCKKCCNLRGAVNLAKRKDADAALVASSVSRCCSQCGEIKLLAGFSPGRASCKECCAAYAKQYRVTHQEQVKGYQAAHREEGYERTRQYRLRHPERVQARQRRYHESHRAQRAQYVRERSKADVQFKLCSTLRTRLRDAIKTNQKRGSAVGLLGCTVSELVNYLESKFATGMNWNNHGLHGWHLDHIKPLCSFDLTDIAQLTEACHYSNLQPLWAADNYAKARPGARVRVAAQAD